MNRSLLGTVGALAAAVSLMACCPKNPPLNTVMTAHGNTDWHIDTAEEFLTGKTMDGAAPAANHCPDTWTKTHLHVGATDTANYYHDKGVVAPGKDSDGLGGIDRPMLFFYAGHGGPTDFSALGTDAFVSHMRLGNCSGGNDGRLRYYWQCSCEVFAHGPRNCGPGAEAYSCPGDFDGSADSDAMRNVYERWGARLGQALRMACGSSTLAYCWETETNRIWDNYNNKGYDVADSFIDGLHRYSWNTPLCITTGGMFSGLTPLFDGAFTNAPNASGDYYHLQYLSNFATTAPAVPIEIPELIPVFELVPLPLPDPYRDTGFREEGDWMHSSREVKGRGPSVRINRNSGAVYLAGERRIDEQIRPLQEEDYVRAAERVMSEQGWSEESRSRPEGYRMLIQSSSRESGQLEGRQVQKNVVVTFRRLLSFDGREVPVLGEGGVMSFQLNNDGTVYNASKIWRSVKGVLKTTKSRTYEQAYSEALERIAEREAYTLAAWTWGYEEEAGNVGQRELKAVYVFNFLPRDRTRGKDYPPVIVKISAHRE